MGDFNPFRSIPLNSYDLAVQRKRQEDLARSSRIAAERSANATPANPKVFSKEQADQVFAAYGKRFGVVDTGLSPQEIQNLQDMGESPENIQRLVEQDRQRAVTFALAHMSDPTAGQVVKETATPAGLAGALNSAALGLPEAIVTATSSPEQRRALEEWKKQNPGYGYGSVVGDIASMAIPTGAILKMGGYAAKAFNAKEVATGLFNAAKYASGAPSAGSFMVAAAEQAVPRGVATALQTGNAGQGLDVVSVGTLAALPFGKALQQISKTSPKLAEDLTKYLEEQSARKLSDASQRELSGSGDLRGSSGVLAQSDRAVSEATREADGSLLGLPRKPISVGNEQIVPSAHMPAKEVANTYMESQGIPYTPPNTYQKVEPARAERIAAEYDKMSHSPDDPQVKTAYNAMAKETMAQYQAIKDSGVKFEFLDPSLPDPYHGNPREMTEDVRKNNHMWVFPTDAGFGSGAADISGNPLLAQSGEVWNGKPATINDIFRGVHDYFGHVKEGVGFRADGEENAWRAHSAMYSPEARRAMTTETRGQNSWVNYGPHGATNRTAKQGETIYADQKTGLLPDWVVNEGAFDPVMRKGGKAYEPPEGAYISSGKNADPIWDAEGNESFGPEYNLIEKVFVPKDLRGKKVGETLVKNEISKILNGPDRDLPIRLSADPFGEGKMDQEDLVKYYEKLGFQVEDNIPQGMQGVPMVYRGGDPGMTPFKTSDPVMAKVELPANLTPIQEIVSNTVQEPYGGYKFKVDKKGNLSLIGDPDEIRSLLPANFQGTAGDGKITFTSTSAPQVKAILEGADNKYSRAGKVEENIRYKSGDRKGQYIGAPAIGNTPAKLPNLRKRVMQLAVEGEYGKMWYERSGEAILKMVGGSVDLARKLAATLAIYSPQAKVNANSTFGAQAWAQHHGEGDIRVKTKFQNDAATNVLGKDEAWGGEKTNNFYRNLMRVIDPKGFGAAEKQGVTVDMWMMRAFGFDSDAPTAAQYRFVENESNKMAKELGWEPQQFQAAVWVAMKARQENPLVKAATEALSEKNGWIRFDIGSNGKKVRVILNDKAHRQNWIDHAMAHTVTKSDTAAAKFDFADGLERNMGQISWETRPGVSTNILPGIHAAPFHEQLQFQKSIASALLDDNGNDLLAQKLGILRGGDTLAPKVWEGNVSPSSQTDVVMAPTKKIKGETLTIDPAQKKLLDVYSSILGIMLRQDSVGYHRPFWKANKGDNNGLDMQVGRPLTDIESKDLWTILDGKMQTSGLTDWIDKSAMVSTPDGMRLINFGLTDNKQGLKIFKEAANDWAKTHPSEETLRFKDFNSDGKLIKNDWTKETQGESYRSRISEAERSDILQWATDILGPRLQQVYEDASKQYGWGDAGTIPGLKPNWRESSKPTGNVIPAKEELLIKAKTNLTTNDRMTELLSRSARIPTMLESNDRKNRRQAQ